MLVMLSSSKKALADAHDARPFWRVKVSKRNLRLVGGPKPKTEPAGVVQDAGPFSGAKPPENTVDAPRCLPIFRGQRTTQNELVLMMFVLLAAKAQSQNS